MGSSLWLSYLWRSIIRPPGNWAILFATLIPCERITFLEYPSEQRVHSSTQFFSALDPFEICYKPMNSSLTYLWNEIHDYDAVRLVSDKFWTPISRFFNDVAIMEVILSRQREWAGTSSALSPHMVRNANTVRLYLKCTFASDLVDPTTGNIKEEFFHQATTPWITTQNYPTQNRPSDVAIAKQLETSCSCCIHLRRTAYWYLHQKLLQINVPNYRNQQNQSSGMGS